MEPLTLITAAMAMLTPFLTKAGEKISEEMGTSLWTWLKSKFSNEHNIPDSATSEDTNKIQMALMQLITSNPAFAEELEAKMNEIRNQNTSTGQMNVVNNGTVQKQSNVTTNNGTINL